MTNTNTLQLGAFDPSTLTAIIDTVGKVGMTAATVYQGFQKPQVMNSNMTQQTSPMQQWYNPAQAQAQAPAAQPNYLKMGLIGAGIALALFAAVKFMPKK